MDYEKKYKDALERAKYYQKENGSAVISAIFPELKERKESEDEQHRKWILAYLYDGLFKADEQFKGQFKTAIAWLEKQGKPKQPKSIWHDVTEEPNEDVELLCEWGDTTFGYQRWHDVAFYEKATNAFSTDSKTLDNVVRWCYVSDLM